VRGSIVPENADFDLAQPPGRLDGWAKKTVHRLLSKIVWGQIKLVEDGDITVFGKSRTDDGPDVTLEILHSRFYSATVFGGSVGLAEAYIAGLWRCSDLTELVRIMVRNLSVLERVE
jgi:cyclopropane-fatty-acyl-phospholipid synthase